VVAAARCRTESRGCHRRADFPEASDRWRVHIDVRRDGHALTLTERALPSTAMSQGVAEPTG
jgi:succinate dehydrogenase/fumarate reductase flavoprotein subunit